MNKDAQQWNGDKDGLAKALAGIYTGVYCIDLTNDRYEIIKGTEQIRHMLSSFTSAQAAINLAIQKTVKEEDLVDMLAFVNLVTLPGRMQTENCLNTEYRGTISGWVRGSFIEVSRDERGELEKVLYTYQVVDEEKKRELENNKNLSDDLKYHNNFTKIIMDQMNCGVVAYSIPGRGLLHINKEALRIYGWKDWEEAQACLPKSWGNDILVRDEDKQKLMYLREKNASVHYQFVVNAGQENEMQILAESKALSGRYEGKIIISTFVDITQMMKIDEERKTLEGEKELLTETNTELRHSRDAVQSILNCGSYSINYDTDGITMLKIEYSQALRELYGYVDEEDFPDKWESWMEHVLPEDKKRIEQHYEKAIRDHSGEPVQDMTFRFIRKDGQIRWYRCASYLTRRSNGTVMNCYGLIMDIDEKKRAEDKVQEALKEAKLANEAKTSFLARMSHDIRTPLNGIQGLIELNDSHREDIAFTSQNREKARVAADHLLSLINDVLQLSKMEDPKIELSREPFNMLELIDDIFTIIEMKAAENGITVGREINPIFREHVYYWGSPLHVRQIFINILGNAIKYNKKNGTIDTRAEITKISENSVEFKAFIEDSGIGMSEEFLTHLFEPFSREHEEMARGYEGTGLGMSIVKQLVDKMGGTIDVQSTPGEGSCFIVAIPFELATESDVQKMQEENIPGDITGKNILLVEDNELNMDIARMLLEDAGANVTEAVNGHQAVDRFVENDPGTFDVILMDVMMPVMNGYEATRCIRSLDRKDAGTIPIIAMTANAFTEDIERAKNSGMNEHLAKPLNIPKMLSVIAKCTKDRQ